MHFQKEQLNLTEIAKLAKIQLSEEELLSFSEDLLAIATFAGALKNTQDKSASENVLPFSSLREDIVLPSLAKETVLKNAKSEKEGCFCVPKTLEG